MMRSLYSGVSGLKTHQTKMDVIGNNISNVNTTAFKSSSITFSDLMSQTTQNASGPNATTGTGGTNAKQIGLGVKSGAINMNISGQGSSQSTGNPFDIMITGSNFFVVNNGSGNFFTRDGSFYVDGAGNLAMTSTGYNVMGWGVDPETMNIKQESVSALRIMSAANMTYPPEATSLAYVSGIIDKNDTDVTSSNGKGINLNFYDALGYSYTAKFVFKQSGDPSKYSLELDKILDSKGDEISLTTTNGATLFGDASTQLKDGVVSFDGTNYEWKNGELLKKADGTAVATAASMYEGGVLKTDEATIEALGNIAKAYGYEGSVEDFLNLLVADPEKTDPAEALENPVTVESLLAKIAAGGATAANNPLLSDTNTFNTIGRAFEGVTVTFDKDTGKFAGINGAVTATTTRFNLKSLGGNFEDVVIDFSDISMFDNKGTSTVSATSGNQDGLGSGRSLGDMIGVSVQNNGMIYASYDNGMTKLLGQIATASFANASGLQKEGDNLYSSTMNSGEFDGIGVDVTANGGYMSTGQLEMSNVDLSAEFTDMIVTQRGFQANSRIITVSDTLLEELTNLKR
ncbi:MAG: flagellar hook-basal body complex protein [Acetatifactor sp.]|nr:flagellar hook-basal body complex protein [Acetatifactor sp.]